MKWRKRLSKPCSKSALFNALLIERKCETTYADILRKVKNDPSLKDVGKNVNKLRRTDSGDLLIVFEKTNEEEINTFRGSLKKALANEAELKSRMSLSEIEIKDLDEISKEEEVYNLLVEHVALVAFDTIPYAMRPYYDAITVTLLHCVSHGLWR